MLSQEEFSDLVGKVYDCAVTTSLWSETMVSIIPAIGAASGQIFVEDPITASAKLFVDAGTPPEWQQLYFDRFVPVCPFLLTPWYAQVGDVVALDDVLERQEFMDGHFYRDWCSPQSLADLAAGIVLKSATSYGGISAFYRDRVGDEQRRSMRLILPHIRRAVTIGELFGHAEVLSQSLAQTIDALSAAVFLLGPTGRVVRRNAAADALLDRPGPLAIRREVLTALHAETQRRLHDLLARAARDPATLGEAGIALVLSGASGEGMVAHLLPIRSPGDFGLSGAAPVTAALFVQGAQAPLAMPGEAMVRLYGLTGGELRVLLGLTEGLTLAEISERHGIASTTVRTHLKHLFEKTDTRRQAELVRLALTVAPALRQLHETTVTAEPRVSAE